MKKVIILILTVILSIGCHIQPRDYYNDDVYNNQVQYVYVDYNDVRFFNNRLWNWNPVFGAYYYCGPRRTNRRFTNNRFNRHNKGNRTNRGNRGNRGKREGVRSGNRTTGSITRSKPRRTPRANTSTSRTNRNVKTRTSVRKPRR